MKAAIVTNWDTNDNYGSLLQNYALQKFLNANKIETCLICTRVSSDTKGLSEKIKSVLLSEGFNAFLKKSIKFLTCFFYKKRIEKKNLLREFNNFRTEKLNPDCIYPTIKFLKENPPKADIYITGSDQVWNLFFESDLYTNDFIDLHFLNFGGNNVRRVACAACICKNEIRKEYADKVSSLISRFEFVSTREEFGIDWCKKLGYANTKYQPDPSFLLGVDEYRKLYESRVNVKPIGKYVLLYLLNNKCDFDIFQLKLWANKNKLIVIYVSGNESYPKFSLWHKKYATIPEWLELFDNAEYIFTNSFHGTVFSIIYNKKFLTIEQRGKWEYSNSRIHSLFDLFGLQTRIFSGNFDAVKNEIDYLNVNERIKEIKTTSPFVQWAKAEVNK